MYLVDYVLIPTPLTTLGLTTKAFALFGESVQRMEVKEAGQEAFLS